MPVVGLEHIVPEELVLTNWDINPSENTFTKKFEKGQILLGRRRAYQKKAALAPIDGICSGDITVIQAKADKMIAFESELLPFIIQNERFFDYAVRGSAGSLSPRVKWEHLKDYEFSIPSSMDAQKRLANMLWAAYRLKDAYKRLLSATDEMVKSQFIEMFGNPITGWKYPVTTLGDCFKIGTGGTPSRENSSFYDGIIPWVKSTEVNYNYINNTEEHLSKNGVDASNCKLYPAGTVLMAMYGQGSTRGRVAVLEVPATVNQAIAAIQIYDEDESAFVFNILTILYSHIRDMAIGGNQKNLNLKLVSQIPYIKVPSLKRKEFAAIVRQADKSKFDGFKSKYYVQNKLNNICHILTKQIPLRRCS